MLVHGAGITSEIWAHQIEVYREEYNLLLPELHQGASPDPGDRGDRADQRDQAARGAVTFDAVARDLLRLLDHHEIRSAHFVGISMGCLVVRLLAEMAPERVRSMVQAGAIARLKRRARVLIALAHVLKRFVPHLWLYRFYAWILLPRISHLESRRIVVRQARQLTRAEFLRWLPATHGLPGMLRRFEANDPGIPTLYVMGDEDHMFLSGVREVAARHPSAALHVIGRCGHVCTVQRPDTFNRISLDFFGRHA